MCRGQLSASRDKALEVEEDQEDARIRRVKEEVLGVERTRR
jgi:hypothetical protein